MSLWKTFVIVGTVLTSGPGCVEFWGKDGLVHEAAEKDARENLPEPTCAGGKARQWVCPNTTKPDQCHWECPK